MAPVAGIKNLEFHVREIRLAKWKVVTVDVLAPRAFDKQCRSIPLILGL